MASYNQKNLIPKCITITRRGICQFCHRQFKSRNKKLTTKLLMLHQERCEKIAETNKTAEEVLSERSAINNKNTNIYDVNFRRIRNANTKNEKELQTTYYKGQAAFLKATKKKEYKK
jgi:hypothetical protein